MKAPSVKSVRCAIRGSLPRDPSTERATLMPQSMRSPPRLVCRAGPSALLTPWEIPKM